MRQTPAAILVLASSVLAYAASVRAYDPTGAVLGMAALSVGAWGVLSLREANLAYTFRLPATEPLGPLGPPRSDAADVRVRRCDEVPSPPTGTAEPADMQLAPEIKARLSMVCHLEGRERSQIVEEALRCYLPQYGRSRAA